MLDNIAFGIVIGVLFVSLLVLFCVLIIKLYINKIKNYTRVIYEKDLEYQKALNTTIIETQEQLLNSISQDLHDDAGQQLTYINFFIENTRLDSPGLSDVLEPISNSVRILSNTIRDISHSLNNQVIVQQDLIKVIEAETQRLQKNSPIRIALHKPEAGETIAGTNEKIVIYRIFQEIINNALKHSKASEIRIDITNSPGFKMVVADNGAGFDYDAIKDSNTGIGLGNLHNRAGIIGFDIAIESAPGKGTAITLSGR